MERHYQINGLNFSIRNILWRHRKSTQLQSGLLVRDRNHPSFPMLILRESQIPSSPEEVIALLQRNIAVCSSDFFEEDGYYIITSR